MNIETSFIEEILHQLQTTPDLIQVLLGPRQVGKTTGILQLLKKIRQPSLYFTADELVAPSTLWFEEKWQQAVLKDKKCILVIDEIQKISQWSSVVKKKWDEQKKDKASKIKLILLGSSSLQIQNGLEESLTGRFYLTRATHWNYEISKQLAKLDVETYIKFGGYPGSYNLIKQPKIWNNYIRQSIIETVIGKDILSHSRIQKPALFRQAFEIIMSYPGQEISYTKLLGQLHDAGNTDLVKHYIQLYQGAFLIQSLSKYSNKMVIKKSSSPKLIPMCGALVNREVINTPEGYGRAFEAAVGACLINHGLELSYWRDGNAEVDFVFHYEGKLIALEVKSGRKKSTKGLLEFQKIYPKAIPIFVTNENIENFLLDPNKFLKTII